MTRTAAAILIEARERIVKRGWRQGDTMTPGHECSFTAVVEAGLGLGAEADEEEYDACWRALLGAMGLSSEDYEAHYGLITVWNDKEGRTKAEVLTAFNRAIESAQMRGSTHEG